ncbi:uncharacterized protein PHALS_10218 [Plasmopara halstedii]|uniref:Uncharacterized protein n=1 Tax=Plasmopara halstedii TaxID=4781 RepID=A0A0N7L4Y8_PLAHL|nr:uncharacterized protein PHALS_10218 [Plasmopara halstedii]CEG39995.1 hypothetical protein PHALS_10218 [Plasmopara halstedii]|eukprot:XP_024576364.1 hypothetical protein PHALS_10218 [Plasmopara halstedii]
MNREFVLKLFTILNSDDTPIFVIKSRWNLCEQRTRTFERSKFSASRGAAGRNREQKTLSNRLEYTN